jgi:hypothetical protein
MYFGFFEFYSLTKIPTLDFDAARQIWTLYFKGVMPYYDYFIEYLKK